MVGSMAAQTDAAKGSTTAFQMADWTGAATGWTKACQTVGSMDAQMDFETDFATVSTKACQTVH